jgi:hypothetical protein
VAARQAKKAGIAPALFRRKASERRQALVFVVGMHIIANAPASHHHGHAHVHHAHHALAHSMNMSFMDASIGVISQVMPVGVMVQVMLHIIIGIGIMPLIIGIGGRIRFRLFVLTARKRKRTDRRS